ncbi:MAG: efflux RND transporter periplasmic adaptor subunit [Acidobacteriota bacterium]|nr:efflux RND transporter periplasmic adaptor subunit [Acidobacteriota bacterium]
MRRSASIGMLLLGLLFAGCGEDQISVPLVTVQSQPFDVVIKAEGELSAARSTPVEIPTLLRGIQRIAWVVPDGSNVAEGELVARLDADRIDEQLTTFRNRLSRLDFQLEAKKQEIAKELRMVEGQLTLLAQERNDAVTSAPKDERIFSRQKIIDARINIELIDTKIQHYESQLARTREREKTELEILRLERQTQDVRIGQFESQKQQLEILAPHAGFFLAGQTWQGEKIRVGMELWSGQSLGELPDLDEMEAKVQVLESEAAGLEEGLSVTVQMEAHPEVQIEGTVKTVAPVANAIENESPVKYFEVVLTLNETDTVTMKPSSQVRASIRVASEETAVSVPNQAIFVEEGQPWVFVADGSKFERRAVELGMRSVSRTVIVGGLKDGDRIALVDPEGDGSEAG